MSAQRVRAQSPRGHRAVGGATVRRRYWKNAAEASDAAKRYGTENLDRMRRGLAPQRANPNAPGGRESLELSHAAVDPYRNPGYC